MNKLMGFYELKRMSLPSIHWHEYTGNEFLDPERLWTIRSAIFSGDDFNLPRLVGANSSEAKKFADELLLLLSGRGIVIYYPYFVAEKSGNINIFSNKIVIEAVNKDLWNLVTYSDRDITIIFSEDTIQYNGNKDFLSLTEIDKLKKHIPEIKHLFRDELTEGKSVLLEWSFAYDSNIYNKSIGEEYLVFYEARTIASG